MGPMCRTPLQHRPTGTSQSSLPRMRPSADPGHFLDDVAPAGRSMISDVPLIEGNCVDAHAERLGVLVLSFLMFDLDGDRIV